MLGWELLQKRRSTSHPSNSNSACVLVVAAAQGVKQLHSSSYTPLCTGWSDTLALRPAALRSASQRSNLGSSGTVGCGTSASGSGSGSSSSVCISTVAQR